MLILAVETSGRTGSVALLADGKCLQERPLQTAGRRHAQTLVAEARDLILDHGFTMSDCSAVAVSHGPGSFTGLRVGIVFAKTIAYATGCKVVAIDTLKCIANRTPSDVPRVQVITDAQRGDVFVNVFELDEAHERKAMGTTRIESADQWIDSVRPTDAISGPGIDRFSDLISRHGNCIDPSLRDPTAGSLGMIACREFNLGHFTDYFSLEPLYLRKSAAEEKWEAQQTGPADA
jgi:tRNA threonylcarbamoyladenosine biosynthesis protein TsaB